MTRAKDISKIVTDADLSGTLDVTGTVTAGGLSVDNGAVSKLDIYSNGYNTILQESGSGSLYVSGDDLMFINSALSKPHAKMSSNGDISFYEDTGTTPKFFWDASAESLGIGTTSPAFSRSGSGLRIDDTTAPIIRLDAGTANVSEIYQSGVNTVIDSRSPSGVIKFSVQDSEKMQITSAGNVGIGDNSPDMTTVIAYSDSGTDFNANDFTGGLGIYNTNDSNNTSSAINFKGGSRHDVVRIGAVRTSNSTSTSSNSADFVVSTRHLASSLGERFRITSNGSVGIGTSSPDTNLDIERSSNDTGGIKVQNTNNSQGSAVAQVEISGGDNAYANLLLECNSTNHSIRQDGSGNLKFINASTERMRIDASGNLLMGTTSVFSGSGIVPLVTINKSAGSGLGINSIGSNEVGLATRPSATHNYYAGFFLNNAGTGIGNITVGTSSTAYNTSSDYRLKENVTADWDATTRLKQLNPVRFNFIADADTTVDGFLAHEVQSVVPEAITGTHNEVDDDGNPVYQGIDQSKLVPLLVKTIQELEARITALETA